MLKKKVHKKELNFKMSFNKFESVFLIFLMPAMVIYTSPHVCTLNQLFFCVFFICYCALLMIIVPGNYVKGLNNLEYKINGLFCFVFCIFFKVEFNGLAMASCIVSFLSSIALYLGSFRKNAILKFKEHGIKSFFMGRELNPRISNFDLKFFCELRPGLALWILFDFSLLKEKFSLSLVSVVFMHTFYVLDALWNEQSVLSTMDILHEGFGFMLVFGDLTWVPFMYSLSASLVQDQDLSIFCCIFCLCLFFIGYFIFRVSNSQKAQFKATGKGKYITCENGSKLLISGFWGMSRHMNYLGDWILGLAWSIPAILSGKILGFFYPVYFAALLIHRFYRDDFNCRQKYGKDWERYCEIVPYKIIPYVF